MQVVFLGGAGGIGASCVAIYTGQHWVLVDAGIRMNPHEDRLPDLAFLQDKSLAAIFVTHAHADHIGALPLVLQSFPGVPVYTSRATMLLMEVMLADALHVMAKRATDALEVPLYDETDVAATLHMLRPLPLTGSVTLPQLPGVVVHTARSGHVAGAMSIGFESADGRVVISGDVSITPQRTVPGAALIGLKHPDLLVLESTYGSRLHPNRRTEEERLAQTVAEGIERGGHVLIPAFALGRAQEVLRILNDAQRRGQVPEFPVWVDGLVRTVCSIYAAIPEALSPALERQVRKGYAPFFGGMVRAVADARQREKIVEGPPACIVSSSGMLTGGPSAFYAAKLAANPDNSILITGYQDEEAPGRRLLNLAEQQGGTLDLGGQSIQVRCHFDRYNLSAHADGGELAGMVSALKPAQVALVHGDPDARAELAARLERLTEVLLPAEGHTLEARRRAQQHETTGGKGRARPRRKYEQTSATATALDSSGIGQGEPLDTDHLPRLWAAVMDNSGEQVLSVRELALAWYGEAADADADAALWQTLAADGRFFVPHADLPGMFRVQAATEVESGSRPAATSRRDLRPGALVLLRGYGSRLVPALCLDARPETLRLLLPASDGQRSRFPRASVLEVIGTWPEFPVHDADKTRQALADLQKEAQQWQRLRPLRALVEKLEAGQAYTLDAAWERADIAPDNLAGRLAVAMMLNNHPRVVERDTALASRQVTYRLREGHDTTQALEESDPRPDQNAILTTLERHLGNPPDLYKRSVNPETGEVTLSFHFPLVAHKLYGYMIEAAAREAGVPITIAPRPHQGALSRTAGELTPPGLEEQKTSLHHSHETIVLRCSGTTSEQALKEAQAAFAERTGWSLQFDLTDMAHTTGSATTADAPAQPPAMDMNQATALVRATLGPESGCYKVSANQSSYTLTVRFHFPDVAGERYASDLADLAERSGWRIQVYPEPHQGELEAQARQALPASLQLVGAPSLYRAERQVVARCQGSADTETIEAAEQAFAATTGWSLRIKSE